MKTYITHHKGVGKLKIWRASDASSIYNSLITNRGISSADLDIYEVTNGHHSLYDAKDFSVSDTEIVCDSKVLSWDIGPVEVPLHEVEDSELDQLTQAEVDLRASIIATRSAYLDLYEAAKAGEDMSTLTTQAEFEQKRNDFFALDIPMATVAREAHFQVSKPYQTIAVTKLVI